MNAVLLEISLFSFLIFFLESIESTPTGHSGRNIVFANSKVHSPSFTNAMFMRKMADMFHSEGQDLSLPCKATGSQPITHSWTINGIAFKKRYRMSLRNSNSLMKIKRIRSMDSGIYKCIASNKYGNLSFIFPLKIKAQFDRSDLPMFYDLDIMKRQKHSFRPNGQSVRLRCQAKGKGPMTYIWLRNGKPFTYQSRVLRKRVEKRAWSLKIKKLRLSDAGNYSCIASNKYGSITYSFFLTLLRTRSGGPPRLITQRQSPYVTAKPGQNVSLECLELTSSSLPFVAWHHWKKPVNKRAALNVILSDNTTNIDVKLIDPRYYETFSIDSNDEKDSSFHENPWVYDQTKPYGLRLNLFNVRKKDSGMYTCSASNSDGTDLSKLYLKVFP